jgi:hypothetical protein
MINIYDVYIENKIYIKYKIYLKKALNKIKLNPNLTITSLFSRIFK